MFCETILKKVVGRKCINVLGNRTIKLNIDFVRF